VLEPRSLVLVLDDDASVRSAIANLLRSVGRVVLTFASVAEFLSAPPRDEPACLVLDVRLPGTNGLELQRELAKRDPALQIVFITGHGDIPMSVRAIKAGAVEFLPKPFRDQDLLDAVEQALVRSREVTQQRSEVGELEHRLTLLTPRERQVMQLVVSGMLNKQIAYDLGISQVTVKVHRGQVMQKLSARSLADLVRMAERLGIRPTAV
jgi:FixJ family two-component response regulator